MEKDKSFNDVMTQLTKCQMLYGKSRHIRKAYKIATSYCNNITSHFQKNGVDIFNKNISYIKCSYYVRSNFEKGGIK